MDWKRRGEQGIILLLFAALLISGGILTNFLYLNPNQYFPQEDLLRRIEVLVAGLAFIANIGLTAGLIYIYLNQNRVLREEMSVLKSQQELMQIEQQPEIDGPYDVRSFGNPSRRKSSTDDSDDQFYLSDVAWLPDGLKIKGSIETEEDSVSVDIGDKTSEKETPPPKDGIRFRLSNSGGGPAKRFRLWTRPFVHDGPHEGMSARSPLKRIDRYSLHEYADNILQPGEQDVGFQGPIRLKVRDPPKEGEETGELHTYDFSEGIEKLVQGGSQEIEIALELRYEDTFEKDYENQFFHHRADIVRDMDWTEFLQKESPTIRYVNQSLQQQSKFEKLRSVWNRLMNRLGRLYQN
jgi:hypothetical protein